MSPRRIHFTLRLKTTGNKTHNINIHKFVIKHLQSHWQTDRWESARTDTDGHTDGSAPSWTDKETFLMPQEEKKKC